MLELNPKPSTLDSKPLRLWFLKALGFGACGLIDLIAG